MHPIYHWKAERVYAHLFMCFLTYTLLKHTELEFNKVSISYSPETILDVLRNVKTYFVQDSRRKTSIRNKGGHKAHT